MIETKYIIALL